MWLLKEGNTSNSWHTTEECPYTGCCTGGEQQLNKWHVLSEHLPSPLGMGGKGQWGKQGWAPTGSVGAQDQVLCIPSLPTYCPRCQNCKLGASAGAFLPTAHASGQSNSGYNSYFKIHHSVSLLSSSFSFMGLFVFFHDFYHCIT